jgi:hypothetical protein
MPLTPDMRRSVDQIRVYLFGGVYLDPLSNADARVRRRLDAGAHAMHSRLGLRTPINRGVMNGATDGATTETFDRSARMNAGSTRDWEVMIEDVN